MASGFVVLENGRAWARRWTQYDMMILAISDRIDKQHSVFATFLKTLVPLEDDIEMGWGFIRQGPMETIVRHFDLREIAPFYRLLFWQAAQSALNNIFAESRVESEEFLVYNLKLLLAMHKNIIRGESPEEIADWIGGHIDEKTGKRIGPGW